LATGGESPILARRRDALPFAGIAFCMETSEDYAPFEKDLDNDNKEPVRIGA